MSVPTPETGIIIHELMLLPPTQILYAEAMHTDPASGTIATTTTAEEILSVFKAYGMVGTGKSETRILTAKKDDHFNNVKKHISQNQPIIYWSHGYGGRVKVLAGLAYNVPVVTHAMPVIGYKNETFSNVCRLMGYQERKWLMVDSTWGRRPLRTALVNAREYLRFDNYFINDSRSLSDFPLIAVMV